MESSESLPDRPPADPDSWTDDQWIEWLKKTDDDRTESADRPATPLGRIGLFRNEWGSSRVAR